MRIGKVLLVFTIILFSLGGGYLYYVKASTGTLPSFVHTHTSNKKYIIEKAGKVIASTDTLNEAIAEAKKTKRTIAINTYTDEWVYADFNPFLIITENAIHDFENLKDAVRYAKQNHYEKIYYKDTNTVIWEANIEIIQDTLLEVPLINQLPELPRGCEVTSLAMVMNYAGFNVDKMTLAAQIKKESQPYINENGKIKAGNPYDGFVGDMYNMSNFGYGVYHGPIAELAKQYAGERVVDLTGMSFDEVLYILQKGYPVWIITNSSCTPLDDSKFMMWHTPTGIVKITYSLHSMVMTGVSNNKIYVNDPLSSSKNKGYNLELFKKAWEQMGNQAVVILD